MCIIYVDAGTHIEHIWMSLNINMCEKKLIEAIIYAGIL